MHRVFRRAVAPSRFCGIFLGCVLRVVDDEIGACQEVSVAAILSGDLPAARRQRPA